MSKINDLTRFPRTIMALFAGLMMMLAAPSAWSQEWTIVSSKEGLTAAIADGARIRLAADITLSEHLKIGQNNTQNVTIDLNGHTLKRNLSSASSDGHVIEVYRAGILTVTDGATGGTITGGYANNGGGICNYGTFNFQGGTISECKTAYSDGCMGGGIKNNSGGTVTMSGGTIERCESGDCGGIYNGEGATLIVTGGTISDCKSGAGGGGIVNYGTATLSGLTLNGNTAGTRGGNIWNNGSLTIDNCVIKGGQAIIEAGGLYLNGGQTSVTHTKVESNKSPDGGGFFVTSGATLILGARSEIMSNVSNDHGGGGIVNYGTVTLKDEVSIAGNTCKTDGGGIWNNGTLTMSGYIQVKDNKGDDVFLKKNKVINVEDELTGGENSIGINLEDYRRIITSGYGASGTNPMPFFPSGTINQLSVADGECRQEVSYYECSWDEANDSVIRTIRTIPASQEVRNICTLVDPAHGGYLNGNDYWFVVHGSSNLQTHESSVTCSGSNVHIILCDNGSFETDGLYVNEGTTLHIYSQSYGGKMGKINSKNHRTSLPGIGGEEVHAGNIIIHGGDITATGGKYAAGIGGREDKSSKNITIWGGKVEATGGENGAGIGGGEGGSSDGSVLIYDGHVKAKGGSCAAGIGGGEYNDGGGDNNRIEIFGGTVEAEGASSKWDDPKKGSGAGIGSGYKGTQRGPIVIHGGDITATGGEHAAGIGGGSYSGGGTITINGGIIEAYGSLTGAAIGGGFEKSGGTITINDGFITANSHNSADDGSASFAAAIGGGANGEGGTITINNGIVFAVSDCGAGIGGGTDANGGTITINGGSVAAMAVTEGAGIGCGEGGIKYNGGTITITGGEVMAIGGTKERDYGETSESMRDHILSFLTNLKYRFIRGGILQGLMNDAALAFAKAITHSWQLSRYGGAGIGGGLFSNGGTVKITGGHVVAHGGASGCNAIGHGNENDSNNPGSLNIYDGAKVSAGSDEDYYTLKPKASRQSACRDNLFVIIELCDHPNATYTWTGTTENDTHTRTCPHCLDQTPERHSFAGGTTCTVCGVSGSFPTITLYDNGNNGAALNNANGQIVQSVTLADRTLYKDGSWNTLCLPFNMSAEQIAANAELTGIEMMTLSESSFDYTTNKLTLNFTSATSIEAGVPYIVRWASGTDIANPVFSLVTINNVMVNTSTEYVDFIGLYSPDYIYEAGEKTRLYLAANNMLYYPISQNYKVNSFRGYFQLKNGLTAFAASSQAGANNVKEFMLNFGDETTGIIEMETNSSLFNLHSSFREGWYTLDGRKLSGKPSQKGIYINNGKKIIIK